MVKFNSETSGKKSFNELSDDFVKFWKPYFEHHGISPNFKTKLCYNSKELPLKDGEKQQAIRFFESELDIKGDLYIEFCDWDHNFYEPMFRKLYKLSYNKDWRTQTDKYVSSGNAKYPTFAVNIEDLEMLNETSITSSIPVLEKIAEKTTFHEEEEMYEDFDIMEDDHYSKMTIRDIYCVIHNKPHSNKDWLNKLILKK